MRSCHPTIASCLFIGSRSGASGISLRRLPYISLLPRSPNKVLPAIVSKVGSNGFLNLVSNGVLYSVALSTTVFYPISPGLAFFYNSFSTSSLGFVEISFCNGFIL